MPGPQSKVPKMETHMSPPWVRLEEEASRGEVRQVQDHQLAVSVLAVGLVGSGAFTGALLLGSGVGPAVAADAAPSATNPTTYGFNDTTQDFIVPSGVQRLSLTGWGGTGGAGAEASGGLGAEISEQVGVTPGEVLVITIGGQGGTPVPGSGLGGSPGLSSGNAMNGASGGTGPTTTYGAGGGGGGTEVDVDNGPTLLAAGGGGGGGGGGDTYGSEGGPGGNAGTTSAGGNGSGVLPGSGGPAAAEFEAGGGAGESGDSVAGAGGGGGGGFSSPSAGDYGGGAGGTAGTDLSNENGPSGSGGGGGGSGASYADPSATNVSMTDAPTGNGGLTISWAKPTPIVTFSISPNPGVNGQSVLVDVTLTPPGGFGGQAGPTGDIFIYDQKEGAGDGGPLSGNDPDTFGAYIPLLYAGTHTIIAEYDGDSSFTPVTATATFTALSSTTVTLSASPAKPLVGQVLKLTAAVSNQTTPAATGTVTFYEGSSADPLGTVNLSGASPDVAPFKTKESRWASTTCMPSTPVTRLTPGASPPR